MRLLVATLALMPGVAHAFCGAYVGDAGAEITNHASQLAVVRQGSRTVLTMHNDVQGDVTEFAFVMPIGPGVDARDVKVLDVDLFERLDAYTAPREVMYTCEDLFMTQSVPSSGSGCGFIGARGEPEDPELAQGQLTDLGVTVEDYFTVGEYEAFVLSASRSDGLNAWLDAEGFTLQPAAAAMVDELIDAGSWFMALRVSLESLPEGAEWLSPVQVSYESAAWSLPLRFGTTSSAGVQDLVMYVVTDQENGRTGIANLSEVEVPGECMLDLDGSESIGAWYERRFTEAVGLSREVGDDIAPTGAGFVTEYAWGAGKCDPCTTPGGLPADDVGALGYRGAAGGFFVTRLHLRYGKGGLAQDVTLYHTGDATPHQKRFFTPMWELESTLPSCDATVPEAPGTCFTASYWERRAQAEANGEPVEDLAFDDAPIYEACDTGSAGVFFLPLLALFRRRRR